jgi:hypothetical protein
MPEFKFRITSNDPMRCKRALDATGIPTIGPASTYWTEDSSSGMVAPDMTAISEAESAEAGLERLRSAIDASDEVEPLE